VKFLPDFSPINLALSAGETGAGKTVDHLGFQIETREAVQALLERVKASGVEVREEMGSDCCYANQDKFWVRDAFTALRTSPESALPAPLYGV
jgi:hypothetical protein